MTDPIVRLEHLSKCFDQGRVTAVDDLSLVIEPGQFITLLGPSGCGKSTTLRMLGGFEQPTQGRIILAGQDVTRLPPNQRDVNMVFQDYALFPHMSVAQNVSFGPELQGQSRAEIDQRLSTLFEFLQLDPLRDRRPDQLSGGQRQRVALARALAPDPKVLLLDEPLGALDAKLRGQVQVELKAIQQRTGKTFIFVTHDQEEALTMSDRIVVLNAGKIEQDGTPEDLYHYPKNRFVADFIGETNHLACTVIDENDTLLMLDWYGVTLRAKPRSRDSHPSLNRQLDAVLRPESIQCFEQRPDLANVLAGRIVRRLFKGSRSVIDVAIPAAQDTVLQASLDPFTAAQLTANTIWIAWPAERLAVLHR